MSTKNLTYNSRQFTLFFVISLVIHIALLGFFNAFGPAYGYLFDRLFQGEPLEVNVVELPPPSSPDAGIGDTQNRERMTRFAGRENRVIKETFPSRPPDKLIVKPRGGPASIAKGDAEGLKQKTTAGNGEQAAAGLKAAPDDMDGRYTSPAAGGFAGADNGKGAPAGQSQGTGGKGGAGARPFKPNLSLPDERIAELTKEYESTEQKGEKGKTLQLNTAELRYQKYIINIKNRIEIRWEYPEAAVKNGWQGKLQINFTIRKDGTFEEISLVRSSGYPALDDAAITALKLAAPFPPFPENFGIDELNIRGQFEYSIIYAQPRGY